MLCLSFAAELVVVDIVDILNPTTQKLLTRETFERVHHHSPTSRLEASPRVSPSPKSISRSAMKLLLMELIVGAKEVTIKGRRIRKRKAIRSVTKLNTSVPNQDVSYLPLLSSRAPALPTQLVFARTSCSSHVARCLARRRFKTKWIYQPGPRISMGIDTTTIAIDAPCRLLSYRLTQDNNDSRYLSTIARRIA
ncbi:hypothetical protein SCHPADRAFT_628641 [Schizopora paradoxa]|uniref:Uncharacterized protein n=1 Tax=Schizopora paradoxa TaxID=27342 RepID=A0A0H2R7N3_9AGAM|nr:hypothetical protein SCHPADRAFT_628641 [Schizopora paradoxa]